jgi:hypothetical protein
MNSPTRAGSQKVRSSARSKGGRYYLKNRQKEINRKSAYRARVQSSYDAFRAVHPEYSGSKVDFMKLVRERNWVVPSHTRGGHPTPQIIEGERRFIEEGLGRFGSYISVRYPFGDVDESEVT